MQYDGSIVISSSINTKEFDKQIEYIESRMQEIQYLLSKADLGFEVGDTLKLESEYEKLSNQLINLRKEKEKVNQTPLDDGSSNKAFEKGITKITNKITRMGLAMIGIRSIYGMIGNSLSRITDANPQLKAQIDGIKNAIDNIVYRLVEIALPVIEVLVGLVASLLKDLFGMDIYSKNFTKNMKGTTKSAKELRKQLMGFDEMNILNKDGTIGGLGSGNNNSTPTIKQNDKVSKFIEENGDELLGGAAVLVGLKTGGLNGAMIAGGIAKGIEQIKDIGKIVDDPTTENIEELINDSNPVKDVDNKIRGLVENLTGGKIKKDSWIWWLSPNGFINNMIDGITGAFTTSEIQKEVKSIGGDLNKATEKVLGKVVDKTGEPLKDRAAYALQSLSKDFDNFFKLVDNSNTIPKFSATYKNGMYTIKTETGKTFKVTKQEYDMLMQYIDQKKKELEDKKTLEPVVTNVEWAVNQTQDRLDGMFNHLDENKQKLNDFFEEIGNGAKNTGDVIGSQVEYYLTQQLPDDVEKGMEETQKRLNKTAPSITAELGNIGKTAGTSVAEGIAKGVNNILPKIEDGLNGAVSTINQLMSNLGNNAIMGAYAISGKVNKLSKIKLPKIKLAKGGIINQPGKGVPIGGERGAEWVQSLTDTQSLDMVASAIGKRIVLQPTIPVYVGNRLVARETRRINAEDNFAYNGGVS